MAAEKTRRNRARRQRRRHAMEHLMAAHEEIESPTMRKRGGQKQWKMVMRRTYQCDLRRQKQQKKKCQAINRQIWRWLQALVPQVEETATSLMQLADTIEERTRIHQPGEDLLKQAMAGQHWIAIGDEAQEEQMTNAGRRVHDGILFRVAVSVAGRRLVALVDSGASQSYISPDAVSLCELDCSPVQVHLELADGSKI